MKITCSVCGSIKGFSKKRKEFNVKKYGSLEDLKKNYVCRDCRKKAETKPSTEQPTKPILSKEESAKLAGLNA